MSFLLLNDNDEYNFSLAIDKDTDKIYVGISEICRAIGVTKGQKDGQVRNILNDSLLSQYSSIIPAGIFDKDNSCRGLESKVVPIWLSSINRKSLNAEQYNILIHILNLFLDSDFNELKYPTKIYQFESELRDDIFNSGYLDDIKITGKEVVYGFGRIDLEGIDKSGQKCIIELKKYKEYNDVIQQCKNYKEEFKKIEQDVKVVICQYNCSNIIDSAKENGFICYEYKRKLQLSKM